MKAAQRKKRARVRSAVFATTQGAKSLPKLALARLCANGLDTAAESARAAGRHDLAVDLEAAASRAFDALDVFMTRNPGLWEERGPES